MTSISFNILANQIATCAQNSCEIMKKGPTNPLMKFKEGDDPVTELDHTIQKYITSFLKDKYPDINIVGQEQIDEKMVDMNLVQSESFHRINMPTQFLRSNSQLLNISDLCIFIDPLDGTRGFVCGKRWECTILIGVTYNGQPILGVIGQPFIQTGKNNYVYQPSVLVGGKYFQSQCAYQFSFNKEGKQTWKSYKMDLLRKPHTILAAISSRRGNQKSEKLMKDLELLRNYCGGSGFKLKKLIKGQVDFVMFLDSPTSTWDSCAGEAIVKGMGGHFFKPNMNNIEYKYGNQSQLNKQGFIACLDSLLADKTCQLLMGFD